MSENYSNPKITTQIPNPSSENIEEYTESVQEPETGGGGSDESGKGNDNSKPDPQPTPQPAQQPKSDETKPKTDEKKDQDEVGNDDGDGNVVNKDDDEDGDGVKEESQGNFFEDNKDLLTKVHNILKLKFPNSNISLSQLLTGAQQYIDMIAAPPRGGQGGGTVAPIKPQDITDKILNSVIEKYNAISIDCSKRFFAQYLEKNKNDINNATEILAYYEKEDKTHQTITYNLEDWIKESADEKNEYIPPVGLYNIITEHDIKNEKNINILKKAISDFYNYVVKRSNKIPAHVNSNIVFLMYIYDYLAETLEYNSKGNDNTLFKCFDNKKADCSRFAFAVVFLCCYANQIHNNDKYITIDYVTWAIYKDNFLVLNSAVGHLFNSAKIDNEWYYIDVSAKFHRSCYNHKYFLFQNADYYNYHYSQYESRKSIGTIEELRDDIKLKSKNSTNAKSQAFLNYFTKNKLISVNLNKVLKEFKAEFSTKFNGYSFNFSDSSFNFIDNIALLQQFEKNTLHIVFRFDASSFDINKIESSKNSSFTDQNLKDKDIPLFFLFIIWLTEDFKHSIIEFICYNCDESKEEPIKNLIKQKYHYLSDLHLIQHKCNNVSHVKFTDILTENYYYSVAINIDIPIEIHQRDGELSTLENVNDNIGAFANRR